MKISLKDQKSIYDSQTVYLIKLLRQTSYTEIES